MPALSVSDLILLIVVGFLAAYFLLGDWFKSKASTATSVVSNGTAVGKIDGDDAASRDFVVALKNSKKKICIFYGSQTGTAEDYATRLAKEAKSRFGASSLVCDPEEYDFDSLDQVPEDHVVFFVVATYGEGEPTDNLVAMWDFLRDESVSFSNGGNTLENLNYVIFGLGNKTYEHFCAMGRLIDERLEKLGAKRIGPRGEGDDDKSMEEDYLAWKDIMWESMQKELGFEEGAGLDSADFEVRELDRDEHQEDKVFLGELSPRALTGARGIFDAKNPYPAPLLSSRELFLAGDRNCVFAEFDIKDSGLRYQAGDHIGVWPLNPDAHVVRLLKVLGLWERRNTVINIKSLDPALAKVPFPTPTTYDAIFRHYLDICHIASRQMLGALASYAPNDEGKKRLERLGGDKEYYAKEVADRCLNMAQVLLEAAGDDIHKDPHELDCTVWKIPFDRIVSTVPRLQPRYYSISSSPKLHPTSVHVTAVVLKYAPENKPEMNARYVFGVGTNYLLNLKLVQNAEEDRLKIEQGDRRSEGTPQYQLEGPRGKFYKQGGYCVPVHIRRSNFRLPTSPKIPVVMIGPGTGVAPFRGFVQERVALARKAKAVDGPDALKDWGDICLFYGCRQEKSDYLYKEDWEAYKAELGDKFKLFVAFSREDPKQKQYVQHLMKQNKELVKNSLVTKKGYAYICGDAKNMAREVEELLKELLGEAKGGGMKEGEQEYKTMKDRNRIMLDVWS